MSAPLTIAETDWDGLPFRGAQIALLAGDEILVYQRDEKPEIPYPGLLHLPV